MSSHSIPKPPPPLPADAHKGLAGRLLCLCGSEGMPGAALLSVRAAARAGAGLVTLGCFTRETIAIVAGAAPETIFLDLSREGHAARWDALAAHRHDALVVGPGLGASERARSLVRAVLNEEHTQPLVLDADGIAAVGPEPERIAARRAPTLLTPHPGEAARLLARPIPADSAGRAATAREIARRARALCILKGRGSVVSDGERVHENTTGNPGMATAGSGDVLCGILGAYLAYSIASPVSGFGVWEAALAAVYVHGLAGDLAARERGQRGLIASDLIDHLPAAQVAHAADGGGS